MNKAIIIGRLTADPETNKTNSGIDVCRFAVAVNRPYKDASGETQTDYLNIVVWREAAKNCAKYLTKGRQVAVVGSIQTRSYEDNNGAKRYVTEIVAENVEFIGGNPNAAEKPNSRPKVDDLKEIDDDTLPF